MLDDAKRGEFTVIAAYTSNRLTRRPRENEDLIELAEQYGIRYRYIRSPEHDLNTADGRMMCRWLAAADTGESERIAERVSRAAKQRAEMGGWHGGWRAFGFGAPKIVNGLPLLDEDGSVVLDHNLHNEAEAALIRTSADAILAGAKLQATARLWNSLGFRTAHGKEWTGSSVRDTLIRPRLAGLKVYKGQILDGEAPWKPIIKRGTWEALVVKLSDSNRRKSPGNKPVHLMSIAYCGHVDCAGKDHRMRSSVHHVRRRTPTPSYRCAVKGHNWINRDGLDHYITEVVIGWLETPENADVLATRGTGEQVAQISARMAELRERHASVKRMFVKGLLSEKDFEEAVPEIEHELLQLEARLAELSGLAPLRGIVGKSDARERWTALDLGRKKAIVNLLMKVTILSSQKYRGRLPAGMLIDESRVQIEWRV